MNKFKTVDEFLNGLDEDRRSQVLKLREYILDVEPSLTEHIKWNAPSYVKEDEDRMTFNTMNREGVVKLVFHMGATKTEDKNGQPVLDDARLIEWVSDIRGYMTFTTLDEIIANKNEIKRTVQEWLALN